MSAPPLFSLIDPLPSGTVAIEASAGTGKTFTLASLTLRYVAEAGLSIDQLLLVTFTRAAAADLKDRVRRRFVEALEVLSGTTEPPAGDEVLAMLVESERDLRATRLEHALANFDTATITTIHGFAAQVLAGLGAASPGNPDAAMVDNEDDMIRAVCADVLTLAQLQGHTETESPPPARLAALVKFVRNNPGIVIRPGPNELEAELDSIKVLRELLVDALDELQRRHDDGGTRSYADVLTSFRDAVLADPEIATSIRQRYRVALIDEFQDTDPVQWSALSTVFSHDESRALILVGDPKQSIYAFRGADVHTYLAAATAPDTLRYTMGTNWRSDGALIQALEHLFNGATFSGGQVEYVHVESTPAHDALRVTDASGKSAAALILRTVTGGGLRLGPTITVEAAQNAIFADVGETVREVLEHELLPAPTAPGGRRAVLASDVAILVNANWEGLSIQRELQERGIPAVIVRGSSVMDSSATAQWREILVALERPSDPARARSAALTWFVGWSARDLAEADETRLGELQQTLSAWSSALETNGVEDFLTRLWFESGVSPRVLATSDGDRDLTDLQHLGALLRSHIGSHRQSASGLLATLAQLEREAKTADTDDELYARQLESDALAVQIMTIHRAKGLEFPIVCVPSLYKQPWPFQNHRIVYFDDESEKRTLHLSGKSARGKRNHAPEGPEELSKREAVSENLRKLYVATTRAEHQAIIWWAPTPSGRSSGLAHLLYARTNGTIDPDLFSELQVDIPREGPLELAALTRVFASATDTAEVVEIPPVIGRPTRLKTTTSRESVGPLAEAQFSRTLDRSPRRLSFSAITETAHARVMDPLDSSEGDAGAADEFDDYEPLVVAPASPSLPLGAIPGGTVFGDLVHKILQEVDFAADDLDTALLQLVVDAHRRTPWVLDDEVLARGLKAAIETPLGPIASGMRLRDFSRHAHRNELNFELHLRGSRRRPSVRDIGRLAVEFLDSHDPLQEWAARLASGTFEVDLAGHLTGSIDLVLRVPRSEDGKSAYVIADYKTNRLARADQPLALSEYRPDRLIASMVEHHYPLQALLYSVALHRYLRWRLVSYQPELDLGGVAYLFVRGMVGDVTPFADELPYGVFPWRIPATLIEALSELFEHGPT